MLKSVRTQAIRPRRRGAASFNVLLGVSFLVLVALVAYLVTMARQAPGVANLTVFCAAGMRYPMEKIVQRYKDEYGVTIQVQYGGSNTLLSQIEAGKKRRPLSGSRRELHPAGSAP